MPALAAWLVAAGGWLIRSQIGQWILAALAFLGLKFFVADNAIDALMAYVQSSLDGLPGELAGWVGYLNFDRYLSCIVSAYGAVLAKRVALRKAA